MRSARNTYQTRILAISGVTTFLILFILYKTRISKKEALQKLDGPIEDGKKIISPPKRDYKIEKKVEEDILRQLQKLEQTEAFLAHDFTLKLLAKKLKTNTCSFLLIPPKYYYLIIKLRFYLLDYT